MAVILRLPDVLVVLLEISDGPAGVLRVPRIQRILRLGAVSSDPEEKGRG